MRTGGGYWKGRGHLLRVRVQLGQTPTQLSMCTCTLWSPFGSLRNGKLFFFNQMGFSIGFHEDC